MNHQKPLYHAMISQVISRRTTDSAFRSQVARGISSHSEHYAYPHVIPAVENENQQDALLRAAALVALFPDIKHQPAQEKGDGTREAGKSLGRSFRQASLAKYGAIDPDRLDAIGAGLRGLCDKDLEDMVATLQRLMSISQGTGVTFNFHVLAKTILRWGNGFSEASMAVRKSIFRDYFTYIPSKTTESKDSTNA